MTPMLPEIYDVELPDGNRLMHIRAGMPIAYISAWLDAGARLDPPGKDGLAHFMEHLHMQTTTDVPSPKAMLERHAARGIRYNATTSPHRMWFRYTCADSRAPFAVDDFVKVFGESRIDPVMFRTEKAVVEDERLQKEALPARRLHELSKRGLYHDSPLGRNVLGTKETLQEITYEDVVAFWDRHVIRARKIFVVISDMPHDALLRTFGRFRSPVITTAEEQLPEPPAPVPYLEECGAVKTASVSLNFRTCAATEDMDTLTLDLLCRSYLTGRNASRLGLRLRIERQLTYGITADTTYGADSGSVALRFSVAPDRLQEALQLCEEEIERVRQDDIGENELAASKEDFSFGLLQRSLDPESVATWFAARALAGLTTISIGDAVAAAHTLTAKDLGRVARTYLREERRSIAILRPV